jgi:hypothetical protein
MNTSVEKARGEIVLALREKTPRATTCEIEAEPKDAPRLPVRVEDRDLDSAIDDMIKRFPKTLDYLAK